MASATPVASALHPQPLAHDPVSQDTIDVSDERMARLRRLNLVMGLAHLLSAAVMLALANDFTLPISTLNLQGPPGTPIGQATLETAIDVPLAWGTAAFLLLSAVFHMLIASPWGFPRYTAEIRHGRNRFRWVEYSLSSTLMIVLIALVTNITDLAALTAIAFANIAMILFGWIMEVVNAPSARAWWTPFAFGCIAGIGPWVAIAAYLVVNLSQPGAAGPPGFVYGILVSIFLLFNCFAVNQVLQYRAAGRWRDYVFGEQVYIWLSITAKSALAWQIFSGSLAG